MSVHVADNDQTHAGVRASLYGPAGMVDPRCLGEVSMEHGDRQRHAPFGVSAAITKSGGPGEVRCLGAAVGIDIDIPDHSALFTDFKQANAVVPALEDLLLVDPDAEHAL